jgi:hypothetical protein
MTLPRDSSRDHPHTTPVSTILALHNNRVTLIPSPFLFLKVHRHPIIVVGIPLVPILIRFLQVLVDLHRFLISDKLLNYRCLEDLGHSKSS